MSVWGASILAVVAAAGLARLWQHREARRADARPAPAPDPWPEYPFDAPPPEVAYGDAPEVGDELEALIRVQVEQAQGVAYGQPEHREHLLRWAAVRDRIALQAELDEQDREPAARSAAQAAEELQAHDHIWEDGQAGQHGPRSPEWDLAAGGRAYVRQEYAAWRAATRRTTP